jgi:hypothetical protein
MGAPFVVPRGTKSLYNNGLRGILQQSVAVPMWCCATDLLSMADFVSMIRKGISNWGAE